MKRTAKRILVAATIAAVSFQSVPVASACGGGGRGSRIARPAGSYPHPASVYRQPSSSYRHTVYSQPRYSQPVYSQPVYNQHVAPTTVAAVQPRPRAQVAAQSPVAQPFAAQRPAAVQAVPTQTQVAAQPAATQQPRAAAAVAQQPAATTQQPAANTQQPAGSTQQPAGSTQQPAANAEVSALAALASLAAQPAVQQPAKTTAASTQTGTTTAQPTAQPTDTSALPVGNFKATLPSNVSIELNLNNGGTFSWVVRNNGKTTQFSGQYRVTEGRLTLVRSNDLQKMAGQLTAAQDGFTFKLDGAANGGLDFKKV